MFLRRIFDKTPRWAIASAGLLAGILALSILLRRSLITGEETTLGMFSLVHFSGYLFFIISPVEILYVHMIGQSHPPFALLASAVGTAFVAQVLDYGIGYALSNTVITDIIGKKQYDRNFKRIDSYGGATIFLFCILPLSSPVVLLVAGMIRYPFRWAVVYSATGLTLKYIALILIFV